MESVGLIWGNNENGSKPNPFNFLEKDSHSHNVWLIGIVYYSLCFI